MPRTEPDPLGGEFKWRLRAELNRVRPVYSTPRYLSSAPRRVRAWRLAPAVLAAGVLGMLGLTAYAATGSPNPVVWTQQIVTKIEPSAAPESNPITTPSEAPEPNVVPPAAASDQPEPRPSESPESSDGDRSGSSDQGDR